MDSKKFETIYIQFQDFMRILRKSIFANDRSGFLFNKQISETDISALDDRSGLFFIKQKSESDAVFNFINRNLHRITEAVFNFINKNPYRITEAVFNFIDKNPYRISVKPQIFSCFSVSSVALSQKTLL